MQECWSRPRSRSLIDVRAREAELGVGVGMWDKEVSLGVVEAAMMHPLAHLESYLVIGIRSLAIIAGLASR